MTKIKTFYTEPKSTTEFRKYYLGLYDVTMEITQREYNIITPVINRLEKGKLTLETIL